MNYQSRHIALVMATIVIVGSIVVLEKGKAPGGKGMPNTVPVEVISPLETSLKEKTKDTKMVVTAAGDTEEVKKQVMTDSDRIQAKIKKYERAKEITTPDGFVNTDSVKVADLVGKKVILVDFWTYSCINCERTLPYLNAWNERYADQGLEIIGIQTPEFEFEKKYENVKRAVEKFGIKYPVVLDNDFSTWQAYRNQYWPRKYLIDIDGFIVYDHIGEGGYDETEDIIRKLLAERQTVLGEKATIASLPMSQPKGIESVPQGRITPEIYFGYHRVEALTPALKASCMDTVCDYMVPANISLNKFALDGAWRVATESAAHMDGTGSVTLHFSASAVNLVAESKGAPVPLRILLDGAPIDTSVAGADVSSGIVSVDAPRLYRIVNLKGDIGEHTLRIEVPQGAFEAYTFTFG